MKKNIFTLVRVAFGPEPDTYVSRSFERIDDAAVDVIRGCIRDDMEGFFDDDDSMSVDSQYLITPEELKECCEGPFTDDFERSGVPVWKYSDSTGFITYILHESICETKEEG